MDVVRTRRFSQAAALLLFISFGLLLGLTGCADSADQNPPGGRDNKGLGACNGAAIPNRYIVRWKDGSVTTERSRDEKSYRAQLARLSDQIEFVEQDQRIQFREAIAQVEASTVFSSTTANDWGQTRVEAPQAWAQGAEGAGSLVAVIDSGVDIAHPDLAPNIWVNSGESGTDAKGQDRAKNGVDDDGNGLIDDVSGYDFHHQTGKVTDGSGHGTHVAGIVASSGKSGHPKGVAPKAKILPIRFMDDDGSGALSDAVLAVRYAGQMGAKVINASWGARACSSILFAEIDALQSKGALFMAASGNGNSMGFGMNIEFNPVYPASFKTPVQITVGASTVRDITAGFSNYSSNLVHLVAPGTEIFSSWPTSLACETGERLPDGYCRIQGTSMATPFVSGAAAVLFGVRPEATAAQIRQALLAGIDNGPFDVATRGRLNVRKSLEYLKQKVLP